ncbi:hypothetical protein [Glutamicibacter sp. ZJUTW]|uniref:hypothetical protein n=1 Tax=Glutamicibacter sp. ZJUTW TaxID=1155384 RepID=UPI0011F3789C|nr:hypothetical protein [Glutamicibacter sp. ZJUTW]QEP06160.1 hypothetical protein F0M17_02250 [Glutamicibacter sp. ZJUTW]
MSEIVRVEPQTLSMSEQMQFSEIASQGDMVPQAYRGKPANALVAIGLGQAMGLSAAESLYRIDVIQGKPTASAELIASNVRKAGHKLRVEVDEANTSVRATIWRADDPEYPHSVVRDMAWAQKMGLATKDNYKKQPTTMLQWRAISAVARLACSEALYGVTYTPDELADLGEVKKSSHAPQPAPAHEAPTVQMITQDQWQEIVKACAEKGIENPGAFVAETLGRQLPGPNAIHADELPLIMNTINNNEGA